MDDFVYRNGVLHAEDVPLASIAAAVGTPVYVYSSATLVRHYQVFKAAFAPDDVLVAFAVKANGNIAVLATLAQFGAGADTVSAGEITRALTAGIAPERIIFSGVGKTSEELAFALTADILQINIESPAELRALAELAERLGKRPKVVIRVNPGIGAGGNDKITTGHGQAKFGVSPHQALSLYAEAAAHSALTPVGLAVHIGSQIQDLTPLRTAFLTLRQMVESLRAQGHAVDVLDLGGGLGVPYFNEPAPPTPADYAAMVREVMAGLQIKLAFEPGRLIAGNAGVLLTRVVRAQERVDRDIVVLDAAMNDLLRPAMYDAHHELVPVVAPDPLVGRAPYDLVGPVCETGDTFARDRLMPPLNAGDLCAFLTAGAYGAVMASTYNARPLVPEVLVSGDKFHLVRERFDIAAQLKLEHLPPWLEAVAAVPHSGHTGR